MADLTRLVDSADCATPGCPNEADKPDGLCRMCRTVPSRRTLLNPTPGSLAHLADQEDAPMPTPPPVPLRKPAEPAPAVATCRRCSKPATHHGKRVRYARLCDEHYDLEVAAARSSSAKTPSSVKAPTSPAPRPDTAPAGTTTPADTRAADDGPSIVQVAQDFEDALHRYQRAKGDLETALERLNAAVEELAA